MEIWDRAGAEDLARRLQGVTLAALDTETEGSDPRKDPPAGPKGRIVCWTVSWADQDAFVWHTEETAAVLRPVLLNLPLVMHNGWGYDVHFFRKAGYTLTKVVADTMRMSKLINPNEEASHGLKALMKWYLNIEPVGGFEELFTRHKLLESVPEGELKESKRKIGEWTRVPSLVGGAHSRIGSVTEFIPLSTIPSEYPHLLPILIKYAKLDSRATLELYKRFNDKLEGTPWEVPLTRLASTPASGIRRAG